MIYIYNCYGGTHSSVLASAYHLNMLDRNRPPTKEEILSIPLFNKLTYGNIGELFYHGTDEDGNSIYTCGRGMEKHMIAALYNLATMLEKEKKLKEKIAFSITSPTVPLAMTLGGLISRWLKVDVIGVPLLIIGAKQSYKKTIRLVDNTKKALKNTESQIIILDNTEFK